MTARKLMLISVLKICPEWLESDGRCDKGHVAGLPSRSVAGGLAMKFQEPEVVLDPVLHEAACRQLFTS